MTDTPAPDSTVEQPAETLASVIGVEGEAKQIQVVKTVVSELIRRRQLHQIFVNITCLTEQGKMAMQYSEDATWDQLLELLDQARSQIVVERFKAKQEAESKAHAAEPPHEH